jgi:hypothetical protein
LTASSCALVSLGSGLMSRSKTASSFSVRFSRAARRSSSDRDSWDPDKRPEAQLALFEEVLRQARSGASGWNGRIVFVYLPEWEHYAKAPSPTRQPVLDIARRLGFPIVDFARVLEESDDPRSYFPVRIQNHYTTEGYRRLAGELAKRLAPKTGH